MKSFSKKNQNVKIIVLVLVLLLLIMEINPKCIAYVELNSEKLKNLNTDYIRTILNMNNIDVNIKTSSTNNLKLSILWRFILNVVRI